ncbi:MAG: hypothetical protein SH857_10470 [Chitinophagales bacterium]|nr:hypothetical protein [Chitinophagales bacterium]
MRTNFPATGKNENTFGCLATSGTKHCRDSEPDKKWKDNGIERVRVEGKHFAFEER